MARTMKKVTTKKVAPKVAPKAATKGGRKTTGGRRVAAKASSSSK